MKKILGIIAAVFIAIIVFQLLSPVLGYLWELFWLIVIIFAIVSIVKKFG